jgi:hypothetical protein
VPRPTIKRIRELVRALDYVVSLHAAEELQDDNLSIVDLENIILTGEVVERQRDAKSREVKCVVRGDSLKGVAAGVVVKIGPTGKLFVVTVYAVG